MKCRSFKILHGLVDAVKEISSRAAFELVVPLLVEVTTKINNMEKTLRIMKEAVRPLNEKVSAFAMAHPSVFVNGLSPADGKMVRHGDVMIDGKLYHFSSGYDGFIRRDGGELTQEFLGGLPKDWTKPVLQKVTSAMAKASESELQKAGLIRRAKDTWSLPDTGDVAEGGE